MKSTLAAGAVLVAVLVGCTSAPAVTPAPAPTPIVVYVTMAPAVTHAPATPTPIPTPTPTPTPTPKPTPAPALDASYAKWGVYLEHNHWDEWSRLLTNVTDDLGLLDIDGAIYDTKQLEKFVQRELAWYKKHPAASCYAAVQLNATRAFQQMHIADTNVLAWLTRYPYGSDKQFNRAMTALENSTSYTEKATDAIDLVDCGSEYLD